jgi:hypothetical protein
MQERMVIVGVGEEKLNVHGCRCKRGLTEFSRIFVV